MTQIEGGISSQPTQGRAICLCHGWVAERFTHAWDCVTSTKYSYLHCLSCHWFVFKHWRHNVKSHLWLCICWPIIFFSITSRFRSDRRDIFYLSLWDLYKYTAEVKSEIYGLCACINLRQELCRHLSPWPCSTCATPRLRIPSHPHSVPRCFSASLMKHTHLQLSAVLSFCIINL